MTSKSKKRRQNVLSLGMNRAEFTYHWRKLDRARIEQIEEIIEHHQPRPRRWLICDVYPPYELITD